MNTTNRGRSIITSGLLLLVGVGLGAALVSLVAPEGEPGDIESGPGTTHRGSIVGDQLSPLEDGVLVYLFHGNRRCPTCLQIEATTKEAIQTRFADALRGRKVIVKELNYEEQQNKHFIQKYEIVAPTVVMVRFENGQEKRYENLMEVWQLVGDKEKFHEFIEAKLREFLKSEKG